MLSVRSFVEHWPMECRLFSVLLWGMGLVEISSMFWALYNSGSKTPGSFNSLFYNIYLLPEYLLYMMVYYRVLHSAAIKKAIFVTGIIYTCFYLLNICFGQQIGSYNTFTVVVASVIIFFLACMYFYQLINEKEFRPILSDFMSIVSVGAMVYHFCALPLMAGLNYNMLTLSTLLYIFFGFHSAMLIFYITAFLCYKFLGPISSLSIRPRIRH
jgi:hypothetical protein